MKSYKKFALVIGAVILGFVVLVYWSVSVTDGHFRTCEILNAEDVNTFQFNQFDSVVVAASTLYEAGYLKELMQGEQYRDAWSVPVRVPIVYLDTLLGGMQVIEAGGGKQTHSLELKDSSGIRHSLRSVSKNPKKLIPEMAYALGLENIVIDGISAQHPYAALVVARLADAAEINHTHPKLVFVPKQDALASYNAKYGNRLFLLEYESEGSKNWTRHQNVKELVDTEDLQELKLKLGDQLRIDKAALTRCRLFDLIIGDWDRHAKQWGWALIEEDTNIIAVPVPADRDNAFFNPEGVLPSLIANNMSLPEVQPFDHEIDYLPGLVRPFDSYFLRSAPKELFLEEARKLKEMLTDQQIDNAFLAWPESVYKLDGAEIKAKIRSRRDEIVDYARNFKEILDSKPLEVIVLNGSEELDLEGNLQKCFDCTYD